LAEELQTKILKQDKQFKELAQENQNHKQALINVINVTGTKIKELEEENEKIKHSISENCDLRKEIEFLNSLRLKQGEILGNMANAAMERTNKIKELERQLQLAKQEREYWKEKVLGNSKPVGSVNPTLLVSASAIPQDVLSALKNENDKRWFNGGCV
jgi:uncharacterized protein YhaN